MMGVVFFGWGIIYAVVAVLISVVQHCDEMPWFWNRREKRIIFGCSGCCSTMISWISTSQDRNGWKIVLLAIFAGCLLFACMTDEKTCQVFQLTWWVAGSVGGLLLWQLFTTDSRGVWPLAWWIAERLVPLLLYVLLQEMLFCKFYGRADCHAFVTCAMAECALEMGLPEYLMHMILAFVGLIVVQAIRGNIGCGGKLIRPVPFLPYITAGFWINYCCFSLKNMLY